jgi:polygalacturonase
MTTNELVGEDIMVTSRTFVYVSILLAACMICTAQAKGPASPYNVYDFGAIDDGRTLDTKAIQVAINTCAKSGGGTVFFPAGTYLTGTILLRNHIRLYLDAGALILGSTNVDDYPIKVCAYPSRSDRYTVRALFWGEGLHDIAISGRGTTDGQGPYFKDNYPKFRELTYQEGTEKW